MFGRSYRLPFRLIGIPVYLDLSFLFILPLLAWIIGSRAAEFAQIFGLGTTPALQGGLAPYGLGLVAAMGLFVCVVLHELGHAVTARAYGVKVRSITLWFLGGVARFEEFPRQRGGEAIVAIVGPVVSLVLAGTCWVMYRSSPASFVAWRFVWAYLAYTNVMLAVFNMLPALPLDGGRVLRSLLALRRPHAQATQIAASVSYAIALMLGLLGLLSFNFFLLLIAMFIYMAVSAETQVSRIEDLLRGMSVRSLMNPDVRTVAPEIRLTELTHRMLADRHLGFPVVDGSGRAIGMVSIEDVQGKDPAAPVGQIMTQQVPTIHEEAEATEAYRLMTRDGSGRVVVVNNEGRMVGIITKTDLIRLMQLRALRPELSQIADLAASEWRSGNRPTHVG